MQRGEDEKWQVPAPGHINATYAPVAAMSIVIYVHTLYMYTLYMYTLYMHIMYTLDITVGGGKSGYLSGTKLMVVSPYVMAHKDIRTLGPLVASSLRLDATAQGPWVSKSRRSSDSMSNLYL